MGSSKDKFISERCIVQKRMISPYFSSIIIRKDNSSGSCSKQTKTAQSMFHTLNSFFISGCKELEKEEKWDQLLEEACIIGKSSSKRLPGILSALSPESATTSTNCEGFSAAYLLTKSSTPNETILHIQKINSLNWSVTHLKYNKRFKLTLNHVEQSWANAKKVTKFGRSLYQERQSVPSDDMGILQNRKVLVINKDQSTWELSCAYVPNFLVNSFQDLMFA